MCSDCENEPVRMLDFTASTSTNCCSDLLRFVQLLLAAGIQVSCDEDVDAVRLPRGICENRADVRPGGCLETGLFE
jgi:hypothetical protein